MRHTSLHKAHTKQNSSILLQGTELMAGLDGWKGLTETAPFTLKLVAAIPETQLKMTQ